MAAKKSAGSKKGTTSNGKKKTLAGNDPPIIVSGGGGGPGPIVPDQPAKNFVDIQYHPKGAGGHGNFQAQVNTQPEITGVLVEFLDKNDQPVQKAVQYSGLDEYRIRITFLT